MISPAESFDRYTRRRPPNPPRPAADPLHPAHRTDDDQVDDEGSAR